MSYPITIASGDTSDNFLFTGVGGISYFLKATAVEWSQLAEKCGGAPAMSALEAVTPEALADKHQARLTAALAVLRYATNSENAAKLQEHARIRTPAPANPLRSIERSLDGIEVNADGLVSIPATFGGSFLVDAHQAATLFQLAAQLMRIHECVDDIDIRIGVTTDGEMVEVTATGPGVNLTMCLGRTTLTTMPARFASDWPQASSISTVVRSVDPSINVQVHLPHLATTTALVLANRAHSAVLQRQVLELTHARALEWTRAQRDSGAAYALTNLA